MELYKQEFIEFMVESDVLKFGDIEEREEVAVLHECRRLCDGNPASQARRILRESDPR